MKCRNKYKLELKWDSIEYRDNKVARLINARFSGPALKIANKIEAPDSIDLDLTPQCLILFDCYYFVNLSWQGVSYSEAGDVYLVDAVLVSGNLNDLHKMENEDFIVINTENHEEKVHAFNLVYKSEVVRPDSKPYEYDKEDNA